jgi:DNA-binding cell septation regulator SpoVG
MYNIIVVRMNKIENATQTKAFVDIQYEEMIIKGLTVMNGAKGLFVSMPREKGKIEGQYFDTVHPISEGLRKEIDKKILEYYLAN